jgi:hypothetical protein
MLPEDVTVYMRTEKKEREHVSAYIGIIGKHADFVKKNLQKSAN